MIKENIRGNIALETVKQGFRRLEKEEVIKSDQLYILGSVGRRITIANSDTWDEYADSTKYKKVPYPRFCPEIKKWDIDVASATIDWNSLREVSRSITMTSNNLEIDPHIIKPEILSFSLDTNKFKVEIGDEKCFLIISAWNHLQILLSSPKPPRPKDISEMRLLLNSLKDTGEINNKEQVEILYDILKSNKQALSVKGAVLFAYQLLIPQQIRQIIHNWRKDRTISIRPYPRNFESKEPINIV